MQIQSAHQGAALLDVELHSEIILIPLVVFQHDHLVHTATIEAHVVLPIIALLAFFDKRTEGEPARPPAPQHGADLVGHLR